MAVHVTDPYFVGCSVQRPSAACGRAARSPLSLRFGQTLKLEPFRFVAFFILLFFSTLPPCNMYTEDGPWKR